MHSAWEFARAFLSSRLTYVSRTAFVGGVVKIFINFISTLPGSIEDEDIAKSWRLGTVIVRVVDHSGWMLSDQAYWLRCGGCREA